MSAYDDSRISIHLMEYEQLRSEIDNRTQIATTLVTLQLTALGTGLAVSANFPDIVTALSFISSFLWLLWIDQASQVYKIAAYIALRIVPNLQAIDSRALGWEAFMRTIDQGGEQAEKALFQTIKHRQFKWLKTANISQYIALMFGVSPLLLIVGFLLSNYSSFTILDEISIARGGLILFALLVWVYALQSYRRFIELRNVIDESIRENTQRQLADANET